MSSSGNAADLVARRRTWVMLAGMLLFLPPLSLLFQLTRDSDFCGTWCPRMFFVWRPGVTGVEWFAGWSRSFMGVALLFGIIGSTLFLGRYWCSHMCPVGATTELGGRLVPGRLKLDFSSIPAAAFRHGYLLVYLAAPIVGLGSLCCSYCNLATVPRMLGAAFSPADLAYFQRNAGLVNLALLVVLGFLARGGRAYCNLLCPVGAIDAIANRLASRFGKRMRVDAAKCDGCGICTKACPVWAIEITDGPASPLASEEPVRKAEIDQLSCVPCRICEQVCPRGAIRHGDVRP